MKLISFQIFNYRSINDSGKIDVSDCTVLVGRNESGKSNLLLALHSLNPATGLKPLSLSKDFPRDRANNEFSDDLPVVASEWELSENEAAELATIWPRGSAMRHVKIGRDYRGRRWASFDEAPNLTVDYDLMHDRRQRLQKSFNGALSGLSEDTRVAIDSVFRALTDSIATHDIPLNWAKNVANKAAAFRAAIEDSSFQLPVQANEQLKFIQGHTATINQDADSLISAQKWAIAKLPRFIYLADYPELEGHQDIKQFVERKHEANVALEQREKDENFERLLKVAGLDADQLIQLLDQDHEQRQQLANRAGAVVTKKLRQLWSDRPLKVRFNIDAHHFDTLVSDPNNAYDVEVNYNERSRGFKWFFSFYVTFTADTDSGPAEGAILLLDEPGLFLHAVAQKNLISHFVSDFKNQILYTTHSPFMIPVNDIPSIRTVNIDEEKGTSVANDPVGDDKTLFPLQTALSYDLTQTLFVGEKSLVVEGVTDYWYLSVISDYLNDEHGGKGLPQPIVVTPAGGAQKVPYMVSLLTSQSLKVVVLLDEEKKARNTATEMVKTRIIHDDAILYVSEGFGADNISEADIEDLIDPDVFKILVEESFQRELNGRSLTLNNNIPRIVKRYEEALSKYGIGFSKTRPAKLFLKKMAEDPDKYLPFQSRKQFETLFVKAIEKMKAVSARTSPFA